jgi:hypothetical protein
MHNAKAAHGNTPVVDLRLLFMRMSPRSFLFFQFCGTLFRKKNHTK